MLRDLLKEGGLYTVATFITSGAGLLLLPFYTAYFNPVDYGILDILTVFGALLSSIISLQLNQGLGRYVSEPSIEKVEKKKIASTAIWSITFIYCVVVSFIVLFPDSFTKVLSTSETTIPTQTFIFSILSIGINGIFYILNVYLRFLRATKSYAIISFLHATLNILLTIYLVLFKDMGIEGIFIASIIITPLIIIAQFLILRKEIVLYFSTAYFSKLFKFSIPLVPAALAYIIINFTDRIFIKSYLSLADEGIYAIGSKFATIISIIILGFSSALAPILYQKHKDISAQNELGRIFRLFFAIGTIGVLFLSLFSHETLVVFTNQNYYGAEKVMPILYTAIFITGFGMFAPGLHLRERTGLIAIIVLISAALNILLNYYLISRYQLAGAAIATLLSICVNNFALFFVSQKLYPYAINYIQIIGASLVFILMISFGIYLLPELDFSPLIQILVKLSLVGIYAIFVIQLKMINYKRILKRKI